MTNSTGQQSMMSPFQRALDCTASLQQTRDTDTEISQMCIRLSRTLGSTAEMLTHGGSPESWRNVEHHNSMKIEVTDFNLYRIIQCYAPTTSSSMTHDFLLLSSGNQR